MYVPRYLQTAAPSRNFHSGNLLQPPASPHSGVPALWGSPSTAVSVMPAFSPTGLLFFLPKFTCVPGVVLKYKSKASKPQDLTLPSSFASLLISTSTRLAHINKESRFHPLHSARTFSLQLREGREVSQSSRAIRTTAVSRAPSIVYGCLLKHSFFPQARMRPAGVFHCKYRLLPFNQVPSLP